MDSILLFVEYWVNIFGTLELFSTVVQSCKPELFLLDVQDELLGGSWDLVTTCNWAYSPTWKVG